MATKTLQLTRDSAGALEATVDGVSVFRVTDRAFRSAFDRFVMTASGTPFTVRAVSIYGAPEVAVPLNRVANRARDTGRG